MARRRRAASGTKYILGSSRHPASFARRSWLITVGFAFPPIAFITAPTKKPKSLSRPARYSASLAGSAARTLSIAAAIALSSDTCARPSSVMVPSAPLPDFTIAGDAEHFGHHPVRGALAILKARQRRFEVVGDVAVGNQHASFVLGQALAY